MPDTLLFHGDAFDLLPKLDAHSVDFILIDPNYGTTRNEWDKHIDFKTLWPLLWRILKTNGCIAVWAQSPFDKILACSALNEYRYEWIVEKTSPTGHLNANRMPMKAHENILVFYRRLPTYNPQITHGHDRKVSSAASKRNCVKSPNYNNYGLTSYDSTDRFP